MKFRWPKGSERWGAWFKRYQAVLLVAVVGMCLVLWPAGGEDRGAQAGTGEEQAYLESLEAFEGRLADTLGRIEGAGEVRVVLAVEGGSRQVLAEDTQKTQDGGSVTTVTVDQGSQDGVVPLQVLAPTFRGALVVCPGGNDPQVKLKLLEAVSAVTGLGSDRIAICQGD